MRYYYLGAVDRGQYNIMALLAGMGVVETFKRLLRNIWSGANYDATTLA